jgi:hypothetical protein
MPKNPRKFWTIVVSSIAGVALITVLVSTLINILNAPEDKVSLTADTRVAASLYQRNAQALRLSEITQRVSDSVELKAVAKQWSVSLKEQNAALTKWADSNYVSLFGVEANRKSYSIDNARMRLIETSSTVQTQRLAKAFQELAMRLDSINVEKEAVHSTIRDVFKKIIDLDTKTMPAISKLANQ